ncbi:uncharacterized protein TNCV_2325611 [Trichonephila clavipes]|nr:uncharacterized protein TNCV_2325611 [Trichonephila clavipes]
MPKNTSSLLTTCFLETLKGERGSQRLRLLPFPTVRNHPFFFARRLYYYSSRDAYFYASPSMGWEMVERDFIIPNTSWRREGGKCDELWFQQDGATCHTVRATIDLLKDTFGDRLISRFGPVNWPPRSCDLTPLDYFLWGYVKSLVYADKPQTLDHLEDNIPRVIADIRPQMLEKVIENWTSRLDYTRASRGSHMPEIIFKM